VAEWSAAGRIEKIEGKTVGAKGTYLVNMVIVEEYEYRGESKQRKIPVQVFGSKAETIEREVGVGDVVKVRGYVDGREWKERLFVNLNVAECEVTERGDGQQSSVEPTQVEQGGNECYDDGDLPF